MENRTKLTDAFEDGVMKIQPSDHPSDEPDYDRNTQAILDACEKVESFIMAIDPVELDADMVKNDLPAAPKPTTSEGRKKKHKPSDDSEYKDGVVAKAALALEDLLVRSLRDICEKAVGEDGSALVMSTPNGGPNAMAELSTSVGMQENVAYMFFGSKEEEGMAHAMGLQTVAIWYDQTSEQLFTMGSTETSRDLTDTLESALPDRSEISMKQSKTQSLVMANQKGLSADLAHGTDALHENLVEGRAIVPETDGILNAMIAEANLRRQKRRLAEDDEDLKTMAPATAGL